MSYFDGGEAFADTTGRIALAYVNPSITRALDARGLDIVDSVQVSDAARVISNPDEVNCIKWACDVGERDSVKLEQQVLITDDGIEVPSDYPWDGRLLD